MTLKLTKPMMHGSAVKRLQEQLSIIEIIVDNDGIFGEHTEKAVKMLQIITGMKQDGVFGPKTKRALEQVIDAKYRTVTFDYLELVDISEKHPLPRLARRNKYFNPVGVTLHQTGCEMPNDPMGWSRTNAHYGITQEGVPILINKPVFIWHAQGLSRSTLGIEVEGNYYGIEGAEYTLWDGGGGPRNINDKMVSAAMVIAEDIKIRLGDNWEYIYGHRQSHPTKASDPGEQIWKKIALPMIQKFGCKQLPQKTFGKGRKLPLEWINKN